MRPVDRLTNDQQTEPERLCGLCPDLATIRDLAHGFTDIVRTLGGDRLTAWVEHVEVGTIAEIRSFAAGLRKDWAAVTAGLTLPWSSGPVEGAVNRIILWIPACAGARTGCAACPTLSPDHPRVRGEHGMSSGLRP